MQKWKTILLDDSEGINMVIKQFLEMDCPHIEIVGMASDIREAEKLIIKHNPALLFLDIHVNDKTSFDLLQNLCDLGIYDFEVIFVTGGAQDDLYTKAINLSYFDCISKPVDPRMLKQITDKITNHYLPGLPNERIHVLLNLLESRTETQNLKVPFFTGELHWLRMEEVEYLKSDNTGTICSLANKKTPLFSTHSLNTYKKWLSPRSPFLSVNGSFLVNMRNVQRFNAKKNVLYMQSGEQIAVAFNCVNQILVELSSHRKSILHFRGKGIKNVLKRIFLN
jgi:two-component system LytT family response regulator